MHKTILTFLSDAGYKTDKPFGVFVSGYSGPDKLERSRGTLRSTISLDKQIAAIMNDQKNELSYVVVDIVNDYGELTDPKQILMTSPKKYGFALDAVDAEEAGIILPDTTGIADAKSALKAIKEKNNIDAKKVRVYTFTTDRHTIPLDSGE